MHSQSHPWRWGSHFQLPLPPILEPREQAMNLGFLCYFPAILCYSLDEVFTWTTSSSSLQNRRTSHQKKKISVLYTTDTNAVFKISADMRRSLVRRQEVGLWMESWTCGLRHSESWPGKYTKHIEIGSYVCSRIWSRKNSQEPLRWASSKLAGLHHTVRVSFGQWWGVGELASPTRHAT